MVLILFSVNFADFVVCCLIIVGERASGTSRQNGWLFGFLQLIEFQLSGSCSCLRAAGE